MKYFFDYIVSIKPQEVWYINYSMWGLFSFYLFLTLSAYVIARLFEKGGY